MIVKCVDSSQRFHEFEDGNGISMNIPMLELLLDARLGEGGVDPGFRMVHGIIPSPYY